MQQVDTAGLTGAQPDQDLRDRLLCVLRDAVRLDTGSGRIDDGMSVLLRQVCLDARARGLQAEQLLILVKQAWRELPFAPRGARRDGQVVLDRLITRCIEEYYSR